MKANFRFVGIVFAVAFVLAVTYVVGQYSSPVANQEVLGAFNQYGYNYTARIFNGTGASWCKAKGMAENCMGLYSPDKLVMKWNAEWDRGNQEGWTKPPYNAWTDNEWNGKGVAGGSGAVWHYKIVWVGQCGADYTPLPDGGYCIWGQFNVIMDQGKDPNIGPGHLWLSKASPAGYGAYKQ